MRVVSVREAHPKVLCQCEAATRVRIGHDLNARRSTGIELLIPRRVERVGPVDPLPVTANLDHLRAACIRVSVRVGRTASDAAEMDRPRKRRLPWLGDVVLTHLAGSPARDIEEPVIY